MGIYFPAKITQIQIQEVATINDLSDVSTGATANRDIIIYSTVSSAFINRAMEAADVPTLPTTQISGTAVITSDARLSDSRTPLAHTHVSTDITGTAVLTADTRLSDSRTPLAHTHAESEITNLTTDLAAKYSATNRQTAILDSEISTGLDAAKLGDGSVTNTEFQYLDATSSIQTQINTKQASLPSKTGYASKFMRVNYDESAFEYVDPLLTTNEVNFLKQLQPYQNDNSYEVLNSLNNSRGIR